MGIKRSTTDFHSTPLPCVLLSMTAAQTLAVGWVTVTFSTATEVDDLWNMHDATTNPSRLTIPLAGTYRFFGVVGVATSASGFRYIRFMKNGVAVQSITSTGPTSDNYSFAFTEAQIDCYPGDYVELQIDQNSGGSLALETNGTDFTTRFEAEYLRPLAS